MKYFLILFLILCSSAAFIYLREKALEEYRPRDISFEKYQIPDSVSAMKSRFKRNGVIIFDVADLTNDLISDSSAFPEFFGMAKNSRIFNSTSDLTPDRITSIKSFLECLSPYKFNDGKEPHRKFKDTIADSLRNSSVPEEYGKSGYLTKFYTTDSIVFSQVSRYFYASRILKTKEDILEQVYKELISDKDTLFFYYADLKGDCSGNPNYFTDIDYQTGQIKRMIERTLKIEPLLLFISTQKAGKLSKGLSFFYQKGLKRSEETAAVSITDISKTLLNYSRIQPPNYFGGYDLDNEEEFVNRDYFAGSCGDTLLLFDEKYIYKQLKYSPEYFYYDREQKKDVTDSYIGINEKFRELLPRYFGGDYAKFIILRNSEEKAKKFSISIKSNRRFEEFRTISDYYKTGKKNGRYSKDISIELLPGTTDTLTVYYSNLYQSFDFNFGDKYLLSYGSAGINAGEVKSFDENSYYGMRYFYTGEELFKDYDLRIFNIRINY